MRELLERFSYRFQLWQREQEAERWGPDPARRNPLRYVAGGAVVGVLLGIAEPFVFHRPPRVLEIAFIPVALAFLILYRFSSRWAWALCVAWIGCAFFGYWILWLVGYAPYQLRPHAPPVFIVLLLHLTFLAAALVWLFRIRERYLRYTQDAGSSKT